MSADLMETIRKWKTMLRLQGGHDHQLQWLACHVGGLYEEIDKLKKDVASLKAARTRERNKGKKP